MTTKADRKFKKRINRIVRTMYRMARRATMAERAIIDYPALMAKFKENRGRA